MRFDNCVLRESDVVLNITKGKWTIKGIKDVQITTWLFNNKYYNVYLREDKADSTTVFYAFDNELKLYKITRKGGYDRVTENGVITDILTNNPNYIDIAAEIEEEDEEVECYE